MSEQPRPLRRSPHWDSGSISSASLSWSIFPVAFPTTSSKDISLQLSCLLRPPFLGVAMRRMDTCCSSHTVWIMPSNISENLLLPPPTFTVSGRIPELPPALPFFNFLRAFVNLLIAGLELLSDQMLSNLCYVTPPPYTPTSHSALQ